MEKRGLARVARSICFAVVVFVSSFSPTPFSLAKKNDFVEALEMLKNTPSSRTTCLPSDAFVRVSSDQFTLANRPFTFAGWNQWEVVEASSNAPPPYRWTLSSGLNVVTQLDRAVCRDLKVVRIWVHPITEGYALRPTKTTWNEKALRGLDFFLSECEKREIKVVLVLADNWYATGGIKEYWRGGDVEIKPSFYGPGGTGVLQGNN